jgi:hypothetical protein
MARGNVIPAAATPAGARQGPGNRGALNKDTVRLDNSPAVPSFNK